MYIPPDIDDLNPGYTTAAAWVRALRGRRCILPFGVLRLDVWTKAFVVPIVEKGVQNPVINDDPLGVQV